MAITLERVQELKKELETEYGDRHSDHRRLRDYWQGRFWQDHQRSPNAIADLFRDLTQRNSDIGPDIKIVVPVLQEVCVKYQTYLSPLPMIQVYIDPPETELRKQQATLKERTLYGLWAEGKMRQIVNSMAWYLPLMGDCFLGIWPDFDRKIVRPVLRSPECAYPLQGFDGSLSAVIFSWRWPESRIAREYPTYISQGDLLKGKSKRGQPSNPRVELVEYSDENEVARWAVPPNGEPQKLMGVEHNLGFNLFDQVPFIFVPDEPWNHGAVEQIVDLVHAGNVLHSLLVHSVFQSVFPMLILEDPLKFPEQIPSGPGAVVGVNPGGKAEYLTPPAQSLAVHTGFAQQNERLAKEASGMADVNFGVSPASSIVTGKAVSELEGAGTGSTVEMVQANGIGGALVGWNEKALYMLRQMFGDDDIYLHGIAPETYADINPRGFALKLKGKQIIGSQRNEVVFSPHLNMHEKVVMGLQLGGAGLVSKQWQRNQVGIPDSEAMAEEIVGEVIEDAVIGTIVQGMAAAATPEAATAAEEQAVGYLAGGMPARPAPPGVPGGAPVAPLPPGGPAPAGPGGAPAGPGGGGPPVGPLAPGAPGQAISPAMQLPPGSAPPTGGEPTAPPGPASPEAPAPAGGNTVTLDDAVADFQALTGIQGQVYLVGEIVQRGQTDSDIEVSITDKADQQTIASGLPQRYAGRLQFHVVSGEPSEPHMDVTPGTPSAPGGPAPEAMAAPA